MKTLKPVQKINIDNLLMYIIANELSIRVLKMLKVKHKRKLAS